MVVAEENSSELNSASQNIYRSCQRPLLMQCRHTQNKIITHNIYFPSLSPKKQNSLKHGNNPKVTSWVSSSGLPELFSGLRHPPIYLHSSSPLKTSTVTLNSESSGGMYTCVLVCVNAHACTCVLGIEH